MKKTTIKENLVAIREFLETIPTNDNDAFDLDQALAFLDAQIVKQTARSEKVAAKAAEKRATAAETLHPVILGALSNELSSISDITAKVNEALDADSQMTEAQVRYRVSVLVKTGEIAKEVVTDEDKRKVTMYKLA